MDPVQWPPSPTPSWSMSVSQGQKISSWTSAYFGLGRREGEIIVIVSALKSYCQCFILKLLMKLDLAMSTFLDINYLLFKIIEGSSQKGVQASSGLACEWVIPEKKSTPQQQKACWKIWQERGKSRLYSLFLLWKSSKRVQWMHTAALSPQPLRKNCPLAAQSK